MKKRPLFNAVTAGELSAYARQLPQGLLFFGDHGIGLDTAAIWLADQTDSQLLTILPEYKEKVDLTDGRIGVDIIRRLYEQTRTKSKQHQCIVISHADTITIEAQHAFLKLLEEPNDNTTFILVCHEPNKLLSTVRSRLQSVHIRRIDAEQSEALLTSLKVTDQTLRAQLLFIAEGLPGMLTRLADSPRLFEDEAAKLRQAREMIQASPYNRLVICQQLKDNRANAIAVVSYMIKLLKREVIGKGVLDTNTRHLLGKLEAAYERLQANGNIRLILADAILS